MFICLNEKLYQWNIWMSICVGLRWDHMIYCFLYALDVVSIDMRMWSCIMHVSPLCFYICMHCCCVCMLFAHTLVLLVSECSPFVFVFFFLSFLFMVLCRSRIIRYEVEGTLGKSWLSSWKTWESYRMLLFHVLIPLTSALNNLSLFSY